MRMRARDLFVAVVVAGVGLVGCGGEPNDRGAGRGPDAAQAVIGTSDRAGQEAGGSGGQGAGGSGGQADAGPGGQGSGGQGGGPGPEHRPIAVTCERSNKSPPAPDGGAPLCTNDSDCASSPSGFTKCLRGVCSFDRCLTDTDCAANEVCVCASATSGVSGGLRNHSPMYSANVCVSAQCHVDKDCAGNYCSPSRGPCGALQGFYCHGPADTCVDPVRDCGGFDNACVYTPIKGGFVCATPVCNG